MNTAPDRNAAPLGADTHPTALPWNVPTPNSRPALGLALTELRDRFGVEWQIEIAEPASFVAIRRPTPTAQDILVAHSLAELERKLMAESASDAGTST
jgi:hypothetical protein